MKNSRITYSLLIGVLLMISCTKDLNLEPISIITAGSFYKTEEDAKGALNGMYTRLRSQAEQNLYLLGEARSEVMDVGLGGTGGRELYFLNTLNSTNAGPTWQGLYLLVHEANSIIKYVPGISFASVASKNNILAQAYAMRAFAYFVMTRTWGKLPLVSEPTTGISSESTLRPRSSQEDIFKLIKQDIDQSISLFGDNSLPAGRCFWSKPAVYALKADVYLWTGKLMNGGRPDFNAALEAVMAAQTADLSLLSNYAGIFDYVNKGNKEIVMSVRFQELEASSNHFDVSYIANASVPANISQATRDAIGTPGGNNFWAPSATLRNQFTSDDLRKSGSFLEIYTTTPVNKYYGSVVLKGKGLVTAGARLFLDDIILYRYADLLLMKAEAKNALDQDPSAEINQVRQRAYGTNYSNHIFVSSTKEQNDVEILKERLLELAFEGKRWWDLIRFGRAFDLVPSLQNRKGQDYLLLFPISETTLGLEPQVEQNPGYYKTQ